MKNEGVDKETYFMLNLESKEKDMNNEKWRRYDLEGLPDSMLAQLKKKPRANDRESQVLSLVENKFAGAASIDEIWVAFYRETGKEVKRSVIGATMRRLVEQGKLKNVQKGCYALPDWVEPQ